MNFLKFIILLFFIVFCVTVFYQKNIKPGRVIILDGPSCSGKTSISKYLINYLGSNYEFVALDDFVADLFVQQSKKKLPQKEFLKKIRNKRKQMCKKIRDLVNAGKSVLLDTVLSALEGQKDVEYVLHSLKDLHVYLVLVYCPLYEVVDRLKQRNEMAIVNNNPKEYRSIFATLQFCNCYKKKAFCDKNNKISKISLGSLSRQDLEISYFLPYYFSDKIIKQFSSVKQKLLSHFDLKRKKCVKITSKLMYDCIVDTSKYSPRESAQEIYFSFSTRKRFAKGAFKINLKKVL